VPRCLRVAKLNIEPGLLSVSKQIRSEARPLYFTDNKFYFRILDMNFDGPTGWMKALGSVNAQYIASVTIDFNLKWKQIYNMVPLFEAMFEAAISPKKLIFKIHPALNQETMTFLNHVFVMPARAAAEEWSEAMLQDTIDQELRGVETGDVLTIRSKARVIVATRMRAKGEELPPWLSQYLIDVGKMDGGVSEARKQGKYGLRSEKLLKKTRK